MTKPFKVDIDKCVEMLEAAINNGAKNGAVLSMENYAALATAYQAQQLNRVANSLERIESSLERTERQR